jgi:hypothetical protein
MERRNCSNCWWICGDSNQCVFNEELQQVQRMPREERVCWGWRPIDMQERHSYLERYGREGTKKAV